MQTGQKPIGMFMTIFQNKKNVLIWCGIVAFFILFFVSMFAGTKALSFKDAMYVMKSEFSGGKSSQQSTQSAQSAENSSLSATSSDTSSHSSSGTSSDSPSGTSSHSPSDTSSYEPTLGDAAQKISLAGAKAILFKIRLPRTLSCILCGAALSVSGLILQLALNNVLASPGIIGVNSGSGFFVLLASLLFPYASFVRSIAAFFGAVISVLFVYFISEKSGLSKTTLILAGVAVSSLMSAGIDVLITLHPEIVSDKVAFSLGGFQNVSFQSLKISSFVIILCIVSLFFMASGIELFQLGDETAYSLGLNVRFYRILSIMLSGILAGSAVSVCGLLGFVGLLIPNFIRMIRLPKSTVKANIFLCIIFGADFLLLCDILARVLFFPYEVPVGLFLSCLGSPFFIWMLITKKRNLRL